MNLTRTQLRTIRQTTMKHTKITPQFAADCAAQGMPLTPDEQNDALRAQVDAELPRSVGGFETDEAEQSWKDAQEMRFADLSRTLSDIAAPHTLGAVRDRLQPETKPAHTPGPWVTCYSQNAITIYSEENPMIARLGVETVDMKNAEFICRACNSHDELVSILSEIMADSDAVNHITIGLTTRARAAIAKATAQ